MFEITLLAMGKLKEKFYISATEEYTKRLGAYCKFNLLELPEVRLPENPSPAEIAAGLDKEAELIFSKIPKGSWFCILTPEGKTIQARGEVHGELTREPKGENGFGYDPLFISENGCFGHLSAEEKDEISHRGKALKLFKEELTKYI